MITSIIFCATYWEVWGKMIDDPDTNILILYMCSVAYFLGIIFMIVLVGFTGLHIRFLITNYTTLEYCEKRNKNASTWQISPYRAPSIMENLAMKLGYGSKIWWFIPTSYQKHPGLGYSFHVYHKNEESKVLTTNN
eukprot:CAMPEP_0205830634 /NCGR_PEP_ID=MMETSP0206-20130828/41666_1 /ASSEMBLY_ACC=CAM_ASM_000279 /TAXON_ID=36767 /ORGANISM="Euplotes focardii, Strain TN1" /LENGTH=135 /DNA_ID=CAMNT_0053134477 /DNA_START=113 /DNA_END=520 /DNA_ORIENTATION=-